MSPQAKTVKRYQEVYVVFGDCGQYDEYRRWPVCVCETSAAAESMAVDLRVKAQPIEAEYEALDASDGADLYDLREAFREKRRGANGDPRFDPSDTNSYSVEPVPQLLNAPAAPKRTKR